MTQRDFDNQWERQGCIESDGQRYVYFISFTGDIRGPITKYYSESEAVTVSKAAEAVTAETATKVRT